MKRVSVGLLAAVSIGVLGGCSKTPGGGEGKGATRKGETIARIHWLGKDRIGAETNAAGLMGMWRMLEAAKLEAQTLDKLARAPWRLLSGRQQGAATNYPFSTVLRPLLDDLVLNECYAEACQETNRPGELVLAIRLNSEQAGLWETNLSAVLESLNGKRPVPAEASGRGWKWQFTTGDLRFAGREGGETNSDATGASGKAALERGTGTIQLTRVRDWTLVGLGWDQNALVREMAGRVQRGHAPFERGGTNYWLETEIDVGRVARAFSMGWNLPADLPRMTLTMIGDGENVITRGDLTFAKALGMPLEPWSIPTNLVHGSLSSFTACRGLRPWLAGGKWIGQFQVNPVPNQFYVWATGPSPFETFAATPMPWASAFMTRNAAGLVGKLNGWITNNAYGSVAYSPDEKAITWSAVPIVTPNLRGVEGSDGDFLVASLVKESPAGGGAQSGEMALRLTSTTNMCYFDRERTDQRVRQWLFVGQLARISCHRAQIPTNAVSLGFLSAVVPRLANSATEIAQTGPRTLSFARRSQLGFTGFELNLLADWLESPEFPLGLHTLVAPRPAMFLGRPRASAGLPTHP